MAPRITETLVVVVLRPVGSRTDRRPAHDELGSRSSAARTDLRPWQGGRRPCPLEGVGPQAHALAPRTSPEPVGLTAAEVAAREAAGQVNVGSHRPSRTVGQILRANAFTRFNAILGALLAVIVV